MHACMHIRMIMNKEKEESNNLVPRVLSYPPYVGRVGENPGNEVGKITLKKKTSQNKQKIPLTL